MKKMLFVVFVLALVPGPIQAQTCEPAAPPAFSCVVNPPTTWGCWIARVYVQDTDGAVYQAVGSPCGQEPNYGSVGYATQAEAVACGRYYQRNGALLFAGSGGAFFQYRPVVGYDLRGPESSSKETLGK